MKLKRILPLLLSVCMVGSAFAGCTDASTGGTDNDNNSSTENTDGSSTDSGSSGSSSDVEVETPSDEVQTPDEEVVTPDEEVVTPDDTGTDTDTDTDTEEEDTTNGGTNKTTVYMVGDSTMCSFKDSYYIPRYGYGTQLENYLNENVSVENLALSGRSSLSFLSESNYTTLCESIDEGDYLIIGFGHNDEKSDKPTHFTDPNPDYQTQYSSSGTLSFQYNLYENYIKVALAKGATPILCTPIVRYNANADYTGSSGHVVSGIGDYAQAIRDLGEDTGTTVIDLTDRTKTIYETEKEGALNYHAYTTYKLDASGNKVASGVDTTHINKYGAKVVCYQLVTALQATSCQLKHYVKSDITEPTYANDYASAIDDTYEAPDYEAFDASKYSSNLVNGSWYHTAFGTLGGDSKVSDYTFSYANDVYTITAGNGSKIYDENDGFGAIFMQLSKTTDFTLTATATVKTIGSSASSQSAFGLMLRDDIYIDKSDTSVLSNYVAAGIVGKSSGTAIFSRESAVLTKESNSISVSQGSSYELTIQRIGQTVTLTVGSFTLSLDDFDLFSIDNDYMYLCMFVTRDMTVEFSNVAYTYIGESQTA